MAVNDTRANLAYGMTNSLQSVFASPKVARRDPSARDRAQVGSVWVNELTDQAWLLTSISSGTSQWISITESSGIDIPHGDVVLHDGEVSVLAGDVHVTAGDVYTEAGDIYTSLGDITSQGKITATTGDITATAGDIVVTAGDISVTQGAINVVLGTISAAAQITSTGGDVVSSTGDVIATAGRVIAGTTLQAAGDTAGGAGKTSFTNVVDTTQGAGALTILSSTANPGNNAGFLKIYVGAAVAYVPYFTNIAP